MVTPKQANADITSIKKEGEKEKREMGRGFKMNILKKGVKSFVTGQMKTMEGSDREGRTGGDGDNNQEDREPRQSKD